MALDKQRTLLVRWDKREADLKVWYPRKVDGGFALGCLGTTLETFLDEMERRGYDRNTFRLSIRRPAPPDTPQGDGT